MGSSLLSYWVALLLAALLDSRFPRVTPLLTGGVSVGTVGWLLVVTTDFSEARMGLGAAGGLLLAWLLLAAK
jgi:hypothetical protein